MFDINSNKKVTDQANEFMDNIDTVNDEHQYIGLLGSDGEHNRAVLRQAAAQTDWSYPDATLIVVGRPCEEQAFRRLAARLGVKFVYQAYP